MKKSIAIFLSLMLIATLTACGQSSAAPVSSTAPTSSTAPAASTTPAAGPYDNLEPVVIRGADNGGAGAAAPTFGLLVTEKVAEITGGKLTVDYYASGVQGNDQELLSLMLAGDMDFVICQTAQTVNFVPEAAIFDLPMAFAKYDASAIDKALNNSAFTEAINAAHIAKNMYCMHFLQGGTFRETTSNKAIYAIDDFAGLKIRTMENANHMAFWSAMGASPTPIAWSETYLSLQQGLIEAHENATDSCLGAKMYEVQDYLLLTHHILYCNQFLINNEKLNSLDPAYQAALTQAVKEAAAEVESKLVTINADSIVALEEGGMEVIEFEPSFIDEVLAKAQGVYASVGEQVGADLVKLLQDELNAA